MITTIKSLSQKFDYIIVDCPGNNLVELLTAMTSSDILISPVNSTQLVLDSLLELHKQVLQTRAVNPDLKVLIHPYMLPTHHKNKKNSLEDIKEYLKDGFEEFITTKSLTYFRKAYQDCVIGGKTVFEDNDNEKPIKEMKELIQEIVNYGN